MSSFIPNSISPVITAAMSKDKGDLDNRRRCALEQMRNCAKYNIANIALIGGSGYAAHKVLKSPKAVEKFVKFFNNGANKLSKILKSPKVAETLTKLPGKAKVIGLIAVPVAVAVSYLMGKQTFKVGQTDQKYTDRAKFRADV